MTPLKTSKRLLPTIVTMIALVVPTFATDESAERDVDDRSGRVTRIDIPTKEGTFTTLRGEAAQAYYDTIVAESEQRAAEEKARYGVRNEVEQPSRLSCKSVVILTLIALMLLSAGHLKK